MLFSFRKTRPSALNDASRLTGKGHPAHPIRSLNPDCRIIEGARTLIVDLRSPESFRTAFIPGSLHLADVACIHAARNNGLLLRKRLLLVADLPHQLQLASELTTPGDGVEIVGAFGPEVILAWQQTHGEVGSLETINADTLFVRVAAWNTLVLDICHLSEIRPPSHPAALTFCIADLPVALDGLPRQTQICLTAQSQALSSFAASLLWNFGLQRISYLTGCCQAYFPLAS